jgi:hypothetical protein
MRCERRFTYSISWIGEVMVTRYFTDVVLHSSKNYHHERNSALRRLSTVVYTTCL